MKILKLVQIGFCFYAILLVFSFCVGCSSESNDVADGDEFFELSSDDFSCVFGTVIRVPYVGKDFIVKVNASENVEWKVSVEDTELFSVSPLDIQKGSGQIDIKVNEYDGSGDGRSGDVIIENTFDEEKIKLTFEQKEKELYIPEGTEGQTREQFNDIDSKYNIFCMKQGVNVALFWDSSMGVTPAGYDMQKYLDEADKCFDFLVDEVGFANRTTSWSNKYKFLIFVKNEVVGSAYGGGDNNVGKIWLGRNHLDEFKSTERFGIFYHEMTHCFQYCASWDGAAFYASQTSEMGAQFSVLRKYPDWMDMQPYHINEFLKNTHLAFGHETNIYHSPYVLEYWEVSRGPKFTHKLWDEHKTEDNSDPVAVYKRLTGLQQEDFNDEMFDICRHFISWDIPSIKEASKNYANKHVCKLIQNGTLFEIDKQYCPQSYGYNGIKLTLPEAGKEVTLNFIGLKDEKNYCIPYPDEIGWRYGFVAAKSNGECVYSDSGNSETGTLRFTVPEGTANLWLVVMGAPQKHHKHEVQDSEPDVNKRSYAQFPYKFMLSGTTPDLSTINQ